MTVEQAPEAEASAKVAAYLAVAVQVAEAVIRLRAQRVDARAAAQGQAAGAARAERTAQHAADRVVWSRALDPHWVGPADLIEAGRAWGAAAGWADTDPTADAAAGRVEARLAEQAPTAMSRFADLRAGGADRVTAMRDVLADMAAESTDRRRVFVAEQAAGRSAPSTSTVVDHVSERTTTKDGPGTPPPGQRTPPPGQRPPDQRTGRTKPATADPAATERQVGYLVDLLGRAPSRAGDRPTDPAEIAKLSRAEASAYIEALGGGPSVHRSTPAGNPHAADVAADSYPRPYADVRAAPVAAAESAPPAAAVRGQTRPLAR